jgi:hypothetical protein
MFVTVAAAHENELVHVEPVMPPKPNVASAHLARGVIKRALTVYMMERW